MFDLRIETAPDALQLMQEGWPTHIVSLVGDDLRFELPHMGAHHFVAHFHDVEREINGYVAPDARKLAAALAHVADLPNDARLLVHCHAGKSRSPAFALGVLVAAGMTPAEAMTKVKLLRPFVIPNRMIVAMLDEMLGQGGELVRVVLDHYATLPAEASLPDRGGWNLSDAPGLTE